MALYDFAMVFHAMAWYCKGLCGIDTTVVILNDRCDTLALKLGAGYVVA